MSDRMQPSPANVIDTKMARISGLLLGTALGDALGLPLEGLSTRRATRGLRPPLRFRLLGTMGFVSDDTEQTALVAEALARAGGDAGLCESLLRRSLIGWFARLPFGIGWATLKACVRMCFGFVRTGIHSAGNGAAMRAAIIGAHHSENAQKRDQCGRLVATLTHTDPRAVEAALFVAEVAAHAVKADSSTNPALIIEVARSVVSHPELVDAIDRAVSLARTNATIDEVVESLGHTGFSVHSLGLCAYVFAKFGDRPVDAIEFAIRAGGDTDTHAAIVGAWAGALHGEHALPAQLVARIQDGPFGPTHLRGLAAALTSNGEVPVWSPWYALARNLFLFPVVLSHGVGRVLLHR